MAGTMLQWARSIVDTSNLDAARARRALGVSSMPADSVRLIEDSGACARAGRAYLAGDRPAPGPHRVVLVKVGERYLAVDMSQVHQSGEFMNEALLDRAFRLLSFLMT